ncbi:hypothetical protein G6M12_08725 [Agrobacterium tumefaciens]|nr:hypothetical protein [Agrobacterium tumefaciens]
MTTNSTTIIKPADEAEQIANARDFYLRGAFEGALSATTAADAVTTTTINLENEDGDPGEYVNADAMRQRYQHMSRDDLYERVIALEGYIFGATGIEAPEQMEVPESADDLGEMDTSHFVS